MMQRRSPPRHRHDGTSPLPMGMDWSPPPRKWNGRDTVWPHDPHTGWSYCVTIPSWSFIPKSRNSDPVVFYRVQVGVQSPEGVTTMRGVLRRFNDFLKLLADLKKEFPWKSFPTAPPKGILRMKSRTMLEERRCSLEEWMTKLLSDIDLSRSLVVASFLELEAAARFAFQDTDQNSSDSNADRNSFSSSPLMKKDLSLFHAIGSPSLASDYGSDTAYEASEFGTTSLGRDDNSESGIEDLALDEDLTNPIEKLVKYSMSNIDEGLSMSQTILEQLEDYPKDKVNFRRIGHNLGKDIYNVNVSKPSYLASNGSGLFSEPEPSNIVGLARELSFESTGSQGNSLQGSSMLTSGILKSASDSFIDLEGGLEIPGGGVVGNSERGNAQIVLPLDLRNKFNRVLLTMHQRIANAKTDMEDLVTRLNQEKAVKDYLNTKVIDLEVELETTKQKNKENLEQTIMIERERFTQMRWDMEELKRRSMEMELKLKSEQDDMKSHVGSTEPVPVHESDGLLQELDATKRQMEDLSRRYKELEMKSKGDIKVLVKEVKSLRRSQAELKQELTRAQTEKSEAEKFLQHEKQLIESERAAREKLLRDCRILHDRLKEYNDNIPIDEQDNSTEDPNILSDALRLLSTLEDESKQDQPQEDDSRTAENELRKILADMFIENARFRKHAISSARCTAKLDPNSNSIDDEDEKEDEPMKQTGSTE